PSHSAPRGGPAACDRLPSAGDSIARPTDDRLPDCPTAREAAPPAGCSSAVDEETRSTDVVVIDAGQAGLSSAYFLGKAGFEPGAGYVVLDGDGAPGGAWQ